MMEGVVYISCVLDEDEYMDTESFLLNIIISLKEKQKLSKEVKNEV